MRNLIIEINQDIERYQETVLLGLTAKQLLFSAASVAAGGGIVLVLYPFIGLTASVYLIIPVVTPIALGGFYSYHGMSFYPCMRRKLRMLFANRPLVYVSTEREEELYLLSGKEKRNRKQKENSKKRSKKSRKRNRTTSFPGTFG